MIRGPTTVLRLFDRQYSRRSVDHPKLDPSSQLLTISVERRLRQTLVQAFFEETPRTLYATVILITLRLGFSPLFTSSATRLT